jgi:hypothetical protein
MAIKVIVHVHNEDPFQAEVDRVPDPQDNFVVLRSPRKRDGKSLSFITDGATAFIYPWSRISFIELFGENEEGQRGEAVLGFFREERRIAL